MFNTYSSSNNQSIHINAVTGAILKNHPKSWFERFHLKSPMAESLLVRGGHKAIKTVSQESKFTPGMYYDTQVKDPENDVVILQMVICGDMEVIAEIVYRKDYEESFKREVTDND